MYSPELESLIDVILADGVITDKERRVLHDKASEEGISLDEIDVVIEGRLAKMINDGIVKPQPVQAPLPPPLPKASSKHGLISHCPNCGEVVKSGSMRCEGCGYVFRGVGASSSIQELAAKIQQIETSQLGSRRRAKSIASLISSFPVPSSREDLLEFIFFTEPKAREGFKYEEEEEVNQLKKAYMAKYEECMEKAQTFFPGDPQFQPHIKRYERYKKMFWKRMSDVTKLLFGFVIFFLVLIILCLMAS